MRRWGRRRLGANRIHLAVAILFAAACASADVTRPPGTGGASGDITAVGSCSSGDCFVDGQNHTLTFEGSTNDSSETTLTVTDPTADRTITLPNATGTVALGAVCYPETYSGTGTTGGIDECAEALEALGGGTVYLKRGTYTMTGSTAIGSGVTTGGAEIQYVGEGRGATVVTCNTADGCTAPSVFQLLTNNSSVRGVFVAIDHGSRVAGIRIGSATSYPQGIKVLDNLIDGASGESAGSRVGAGVLIGAGLSNTIEGNQIRWFGECFKGVANSGQGINANEILANECSLSDDGWLVTVGNIAANVRDGGGNVLRFNQFQSLYRYGALVQYGNSDGDDSPDIIEDNWFELMDSGIVLDGGSGSYESTFVSRNNVFGSMSDVAGTAGKPDADSLAVAILTTSDYNANFASINDRTNSVNCISHGGGGLLTFDLGTPSASPCVPDVTGSGGIAPSATASGFVIEGATEDAFETTIAATDPTADRTITLPNQTGTVALADAVTTLSADWVNTANPWADNEVSDTLTASTSTTAAANDNDTSIATTAFVQQEIDDGDNLSDNCAVENDATPIPDSCVGDGSDDDVPDAGEVDDTALAAGAVDGGAAGEIADNSVTGDDIADGYAGRSLTETTNVLDVDAEIYTRTCDFAVEVPVAGDDGDLQCYFPTAATLTRVYCSTDTGTSVINFYERAEATPNTGTTDMLTSDLTCDTDGQATTTFTDSAIAADALLALGLQTTFTTGWVRVHAEFTVND